ncbi:MAG TPA: metallophosphoesterase family protein [Roseateles sp.]|nr:metallophosphoesterase family protein [Roseateles sp.]
MRIALVSDIHGNLAALEAVVADIARRSVDRIVNLGDSLSGPLLPRETAQYLMAAGWPTLAGNHERQILEIGPDRPGAASDAYARAQLGAAELDWLRGLPPTLRLTDEVFLCHGTPRSDLEYFLESVAAPAVRVASAAEVAERLAGETAPVVACGHTHVQRSLRSPAGQLLLNPGSVGLQAYDDDHPVFHLVEMGSTDARYAIIERRPEGWHSELLAVPYDFRAMARLAQQRGRPDWERALLTGYMG